MMPPSVLTPLSRSFWDSYKSTMKEIYLPLPDNFVFEDGGKAAGFISLVWQKVAPSL
jgi:putative acetyltransferase